MSADCPFCKIVEGMPPWALSHGASVVSFKPFGAATPMHRLFVPRLHVEGAEGHPAVTSMCFYYAAKWAEGKGRPFNLVVNSGEAAGQSVAHLHVHYVPRADGDGLGYRWKPDVPTNNPTAEDS